MVIDHVEIDLIPVGSWRQTQQRPTKTIRTCPVVVEQYAIKEHSATMVYQTPFTEDREIRGLDATGIYSIPGRSWCQAQRAPGRGIRIRYAVVK